MYIMNKTQKAGYIENLEDVKNARTPRDAEGLNMITANNYTLHADAVAGCVDRLARAYDYYEYINAVDDPDAHARQIRADILAEDPANVNDIISWLLALIQAGGTPGREAAVILARVENIRNAAGLAPADL